MRNYVPCYALAVTFIHYEEMSREIKPGTFVIRTDPAYPEVGIVVATWIDEHGHQDCYIAFYGETWPKLDAKPSKPYILRYYASGLRIVEPNFGE